MSPAAKRRAKRLLTRLMPRGSLLWCVPQPSGRRALALTFDDGPDPDGTPRILRALARLGARATFFVLGENAARHPGLLREILAAGHELGNHSYSHARLGELPAPAMEDELLRTDALIRENGGSAGLLRPPHGDIPWRRLPRIRHLGWTLALWTVDTRDWSATSPDEIARRVNDGGVRSGDILLLHDRFPATAEVLPQIGEFAAGADYRLDSIGRLM